MASIVDSHGLLSPAPSNSSPPPDGSHSRRGLPVPRSQPLKPGGRKESSLINFADDKILRITRRYGKKFSESPQSLRDDTPGYTSFEQVVQDLEAVFEVVWISGTPAIQTPYLLSLAGLFCSYMPAFPFSSSTFRLAKKIDLAFVSLLQGSPSEPSSDHQRFVQRISMTDKVRIKSLVEETRVVAVETASTSGHAARIQELSISDESDSEETTEDEDVGVQDIDDISIGISKIYRHTMEILGDSLP